MGKMCEVCWLRDSNIEPILGYMKRRGGGNTRSN
jgi:hypothetical protein